MKKLLSAFLSLALICSIVSVGAINVSADEVIPTTETFLDRVRNDYELVWSDEFNGDTLDTTKWRFDGQMTRRNSELHVYADSMEDGNLQFDGENAVIVPKVETRVSQDGRKFKYTSAEISTQGIQSWKYGYFEIRAKLSCGKNIVPAIWMMGYDYPTMTCDWPYSGEIDIMERLNNDKQTESTLHYSSYGNHGSASHKAASAGTQTYDHKINEEFHNYWLYWTDKYLIIGVDDSMHNIVDITKPELAQSFRTFEQFLILNVALGMFANPVDDSQEDEWKMWIDYVRVYQLNDDKLYDNYKTFGALDLMNNGSEYAYGKTVSTLKTESQLDFTMQDELEPGKYDVYAEINNVNTTASINGVETNKITKVDHGKVVGNQAYVGSVDLQDNSAFDISFSGSVTVEKLIFVKTDENKTTPVVVNKDSCVTVSDYFEVSTEDELVSAANYLLPGGTIKLLDDITLTKNVQLFNNDVIDLNGKTITVNNGRFLINSENEAITVKNGNVIISGNSSNFIHTKENNYNAKVKCEDLNITINSTASSGYVFNHNYGDINIEANNCEFTFGESVSSSSSYIISRNAGIYNNCTFNLKGRKAFLMSNGSSSSPKKLYFNNCVVNDALYLFHSDNALTQYVDVKLANTTLNNLGALTNFDGNAQFVSVADNNVLKQNGEVAEISASMTGNFTMECNHSYIDATCLTPKHCQYCNLSEGKALGHTPVTTTTPADCLYKGSIKTECSTCFTVLSEVSIPVTEHNYVFSKTIEPSCSQAGYHLWVCSGCGMQQQRSYNGDGAVVRPAHTYDESQTVVVAPTCTKGGYSLKYCTSCKTQRQTLYKWSSDHDYESIYNEDEGSVTYKCKNCEDSYVDACIHKATDGADVVVAPTCTKQGYTEHLCSVCSKTYKDTYTSATGIHIANEATKQVIAPTCTEKGYTTYGCKYCGIEIKQDYVDELGHIPNEATKQVIAPTCTEKGYTTYGCKYCGIEIKQDYVDELGHTEVIDTGYAPTCTEKGLSDGSHCDVCKETIVTQKTINELGHSEVVLKGYEATCTEEGLSDGLKCNREGCNKVLKNQEVIDKLGHQEVLIKGYAATCTKNGKTDGKYCSRCEKIIVKQQPILPTGHNVVSTLYKAPSYIADGNTSGTYCTTCKTVYLKEAKISRLELDKPVVKLSSKKGKLTVKYSGVAGANKYEVQIKINKKWKKITTKKQKYTIKLEKGKTYKVRVRAIAVGSNVTYYSKYSKITSIKVK